MRQKGLAIVFVMVLLVVLSMMIISRLQNLLAYAKVGTLRLQSQQADYALESFAYARAKHSMDSQCMVDGYRLDDPGSYFSHYSTCSAAHYRYIWEVLPVDTCWVAYYNKQRTGVGAYRLTVQDAGRRWLQILVFKPGELKPCQTRRRLVKLGIASWRFLSI